MLVCFLHHTRHIVISSLTLARVTNGTGLVILYGLFFGLSLFFWWFGVAAVLLLCVTLYVVYVMSMQSTQILSLKVVDFAAKIDTAKAHGSSDTEPGMNVPLLTSEMEHLQRQMVMLMFAFFSFFIFFTSFSAFLMCLCCLLLLCAGVSGSSSWRIS